MATAYTKPGLPMKAIAEVQIIPLGAGVSVRKEVMGAHELSRGVRPERDQDVSRRAESVSR